MKTLLFLLMLLPLSAFSTNYYLSGSGNDNNSGTSPANAWRNIQKLNTIVLSPGDTVLFQSGDSFRGTINIQQSGTNSIPIVFFSFGSGIKPVISGADVITGWVAQGNGYVATINQPARNFYVNDREMTVARFPNEHSYLWLDSATQSVIYDAQLSVPQITNWIGTKACIHTAQWCWEKSQIMNYVSGELTISPTQIPAINGYGYFLYNNIALLDTALEYYNDTTTHQLFYIPPQGQDPNTQLCDIAVQGAGMRIFPNVSYIKIFNLAFDKQGMAGIQMSDSTNSNITIDRCFFTHQYIFGVQVRGKYHLISNSFFSDVDGHGIDVSSGGNTQIHHNLFIRNGQFRNSGLGGQTNCSAIAINFTDSCFIHHNVIDSVGYCGISADGAYHVIERNSVNNAMMLNNDGAAYKTFGSMSHDIIFRNNIAIGSNGNTEGTFNANFRTPAFYCDFNSNNILLERNTVYNHTATGIFLNSGSNNIDLIGNVVYGANTALEFNGGQQPGTFPSFGHSAVHNVCFALNPQGVCMRQVDYTQAYNYNLVDSNYYWQPYDSLRTCMRLINPPQPTLYSLSEWQDSTGEDLDTKKQFVTWNFPVNHSQIFVNTSDSLRYFQLNPTQYLDLDSNIVCDSIAVRPYSSKVLIATGTNCITTGISENKIPSGFGVYPNPAKDIINIVAFADGNYTVRIFNLTGQIVAESKFTDKLRMDLHKLGKGMYVIDIYDQSGTTVQREKVVKM